MSIITIVGRPNVGKSSIFNRLVGERVSIEANEPGTTRDRIFGVMTYRDNIATVIDSAGIDFDKSQLENAEIKKFMDQQISIALDQADVILFVIDAKEGITIDDEKIVDLIRKRNRPVVICANKADYIRDEQNATLINSMGFDGVYPVSAIHNNGIENLKSKLFSKIKSSKKVDKFSGIRVALSGRPNVGKSTLLNYFAGAERSIVAPIAGTTRDTVNQIIEYKGKRFEFIDTAGIRKRGKIVPGIEKFSVMRSVKAVQDSDIVVLLVDAAEGVKAGDAHIAGLAIELGKGLVVAVNKWDINKFKSSKFKVRNEGGISNRDDYEQRVFIAELRDKFAFMAWAPIIFISAHNGLNCNKLLERIKVIDVVQNKKIDPSLLNKIQEIAKQKQPRLSLIYAINQLSGTPPTFELVVNKPDSWHFSDLRLIENVIRTLEPYEGTPVKIVLTPYAKSQPRD